jgi:hypothetical protein
VVSGEDILRIDFRGVYKVYFSEGLIANGAEGETRQIENFDLPYPTNLLYLHNFLDQFRSVTYRSV